MRDHEPTDLDQALARAGDGAFAIGGDGRIVLWNRAAERIRGYWGREAIGRLCCDVFVGQDDKGNRLCYQGCHVMTLVKLGESIQNFDMRTRTKAGRPLTRRELETLRPLAGGARTKILAERLHVSPATVRNHVQNIFGKMGVHSRLEAVAYANQRRLL